ncbi:MAG: helix-turn-helix transcriptional regulator [Gammaproteobacteria bacterium]
MSSSQWNDLLEGALKAKSVDDLHKVGSSLCRRLGFDSFFYGAQFPTSFTKPQTVAISAYPAEWVDHYNNREYIRIDPIVAHSVDRQVPLIWSQIPADGKGKQFLSEACDFGLRSGVSFPIHGHCGERGVLSLAIDGEASEAESTINNALPIIGLMVGYIHEASLRIFGGKVVQLGCTPLTQREKECLMWVADGKTSWETSKILDISERTVIFHLQNCAAKLNVNNRQHAVARAISQGLIAPVLS